MIDEIHLDNSSPRAIDHRSDGRTPCAPKDHRLASELDMQPLPAGIIEEMLGAIFVDGQRCEVWVRSEPDGDGTWHNALLFRRTGRIGSKEALITGVSWHVPPGVALDRARELGEQEQIALFRRALAPRPPVV